MTTKVHWGLGADQGVPQNKITQGLANLMMQQSLLTLAFDQLMDKLSKQIDESATNLNKDTALYQKADIKSDKLNGALMIGTIFAAFMMGGPLSLYSIEEEESLSGFRKIVNNTVNKTASTGMKMNIYSMIFLNVMKAVCTVLSGKFKSKEIDQQAQTDNLKYMLQLTTTSNNKISIVSQALATAIKDALENNYRAEKVNITKVQ